MATIRAQGGLGRKTKSEAAVTKHQQKGIKNFLRFPIKRDYCNKFESLVATPYPNMMIMTFAFCAFPSLRHFAPKARQTFSISSAAVCVVKDDKNFYIFSVVLLAHTNCRALNKYLYFHQRRYGRHRETTKKRRIKKETAAEAKKGRIE